MLCVLKEKEKKLDYSIKHGQAKLFLLDMEDCGHILHACVQVSMWLFPSVEILDFDFIFIIYALKCQHHATPTKHVFILFF